MLCLYEKSDRRCELGAKLSILAVARARVKGFAMLDVNVVCYSRRVSPVLTVWRRRFGFSPKISTTVENTVENAGLYAEL